MIDKNIDNILDEIKNVLSSVNNAQVDNMIELILNANTIVTCGAGRVGYAIKGFSMRLSHLGLKAYNLGDSNVPSISNNDLLIVSSGSGETQTIYDIVSIAYKNKASIIYVGGDIESRISNLSNTQVIIKAPSKTRSVDGFTSIQPMTTLNEQCLNIFFDGVVLDLMERMNETHDSMWERHSNLE